MRTLGLGLGLSRHGGLGSAAPSDMASYDMTLGLGTGYTTSGGVIDRWINQGSLGVSADAIPPSAGDSPVVGNLVSDGSVAAFFTNLEEWFEANALSGLVDNAATTKIEVDIVVEVSNIAAQQVFFIWSDSASNNGYLWVGTNGFGDLRILRRDPAGTQKNVDSASVLSQDTKHAITVSFNAGLVDAWVDGLQVLTAADYVGTTGNLATNQFAIGARKLINASLGTEGFIQKLAVRSL
ncbi:MAG: hypothetical protein D6773_04430 [Alphaproteobacteria bacterium]|nr:MAG: hypothetical protein D6773_04430 [Alphaproteobacteria bacterium]